MSVRDQLKVRRAHLLHRLQVQCGAESGDPTTEAVSPQFWALLGIGAVAGGVLLRTRIGGLALSTARGFAVKILVDRMTRFAAGTRPASIPRTHGAEATPPVAEPGTPKPVVEVSAAHRPPQRMGAQPQPEVRQKPRELTAEAT